MNDTGRLRDLIQGYRTSAALHVVAVLGISDLLVEGPRSVDDLAAAADVDADALGRVLRALAAVGVYTEDDRGWFANNAESNGLRSGVPGSVAAMAGFIGQSDHWSTWGHLLHTVRTGENGFADLYGTDVWTYRAGRPDQARLFDAWMAANTQTIAAAVIAAYDFTGARVVVDVAGGTGALLGAVLEAHPQLTGILLEQPEVIARAAELIATTSWGERCQLVSGSMFEAVPAGGDVYLVKSILHDWSDPEAVEILSCCREAMAGSARLLILERLLEGPNRGAETKLSDLNMMVMLGGRERTSDEFAALCARAGLRLDRTLPTGTPWFVLEAVRS